MMLDCLVIGGGVAGLQCALVLGSAKDKRFAKDKKIVLLNHQDKSHLKNAIFNNVLGLKAGTLGENILKEGTQQLMDLYPHIEQVYEDKVHAVLEGENGFKVLTESMEFTSKIVVIALNYAKPFGIAGLEQYIEPHTRANPSKDRIQIRNYNHLVKEGLYVCGTIAGHRSQLPIAAGSGAAVATDILTLWNDGIPTKVHDKIKKS